MSDLVDKVDGIKTLIDMYVILVYDMGENE
jgi:hypothetical protein